MDGPARGGLELYIAEARDVKASKVVRWLLKADTTCRACGLPIRRNGFGEWVDGPHHDDRATRGKVCLAPGFVQAKLRIPHRPDQWTPERLAATDKGERERIRKAAGVARRCSGETWTRVVELYAAAVADRAG